MRISPNNSLVSAIRDGDYFMVRADHHGIAIDYAPTAMADAVIIGAFAAHKGKALFWNAHEAGRLLEQWGEAFEQQLSLRIELGRDKNSNVEKKKPMHEEVFDLLRNFANGSTSYTTENPLWDGPLEEFQQEFFYPVRGELWPLTTLAKTMKSLSSRVPGIEVAKIGKQWSLSVRWAQIKDPDV